MLPMNSLDKFHESDFTLEDTNQVERRKCYMLWVKELGLKPPFLSLSLIYLQG